MLLLSNKSSCIPVKNFLAGCMIIVLLLGQTNIQPIIINQELRASGGAMPMVGIKTSSGNGSGRAAVPHPAIVMSRSHQNGAADLKQAINPLF